MSTPYVYITKTQSGREDNLASTIFTLTRTGNLSSELTVNLLLQGTAKAGSDYTAPANLGANNTLTVTFAAGSATATLSLPTLADNVVDPYDNIVAILQPGNGYSITPGSDRAEVIIQAEGVTAVPKSGGEHRNYSAFAALKKDGSVVTWGDSFWGGDSSSVASQLSQVTQIFSTRYAFAALKADGSVVTWGESSSGGDSSSVAGQLSQVTQIFSTRYAFAALKADGSVVTWGESSSGGDSSSVAGQLSQVTQIFSTGSAFAALKADGSVVTWGESSSGGNSSTVASQLSQVTQIFSTRSAFAALKADGSVVTWGHSFWGGNSSSVASQLSQGVTQIFSTRYAFAALKKDGSVVTWGHRDHGGNSSTVADKLSQVTQIFSTGTAFAALKADGSVVTWGHSDQGGESSLLVNDQEDLNYETNPTLSLTAQASNGSFTNDATITVNLTDVNEKPIITSPNTVNVPENTREVLTVQATDPEGDSLTFFIIGGADANLFQINPHTGNLSFEKAPDFENPASAANTNTYQVLVAVIDHSLIDVQVIRVTVADVNEAPTFNNQTFTLPENSTNNTLIGTLSATDPEGATLSYSITNNSDPNNNGTPAFLLQGNRLLVNDQEDLNYETNPTLSLTAQASDGSFTNDATITVNLTDVNEKPIITSPNTVNVPENTREVLTVQATDPEGDSLTFSIIEIADANLFQINPHTGNLSFKTAPDFENPASAANTNTYEVLVAVIDHGLIDVQVIRIAVTDVNEAPTFNNQTFPLPENSTNNTLIGTLVATDPEGATLSYSITNNPDPNNNGTPAFRLQGNRLLVNDQEDLNYETNPTLSITAQASDGSFTNDATITVNLTDVNEKPTITSPNTVNVPENTREVLTVQATDPEGDSLTFSMIEIADANLFQINPHTGNLSFEKAPDFENPASAANTNTYQVQVRVIDNGNLTAVQDIRVTVTDVNEAPSFNNQTFTLPENSTEGTVVGTLVATDPEGATLSYSITNNPDPNNNGTPAFLLQGNRLLVNDQEDLNYETNPTLSITAQASDGSETNDATITVNLTDVNEKPIITSPNTVNVPENTREVLTVQATNPEGDSLTFSIIEITDANLFQINPHTGNLSFEKAPDFENPASAANTNTYQVQVKVIDNGNLTAVQLISVTVTDVNEAPTFNNQTFTLLENSTNNTLIGTLSATDPEGATLSYSITNNPDPNNNGTPAFLLQGNQLLVNDRNDLNYETNPTLSITAQASDGSFTNDATITVNLTDVNEKPIITFPNTVNVPENTREVLTVQATDPEGDSLTFSIIGGADANLFQINPNTGNLSFETAPDFENPASAANTNTYQVQVAVTDNSLYNVQVIRVAVTDVNEAPTFNNQTFTLAENSTNNTLIGTLSATDPEGATLSYSITNNPDPNNNGTPAFLLQGNRLLVNDQEDLDYETKPNLSLTAQASDGSFTNDATITVNLTDVIGEYGTLNNVNHLWQTIILNESYTNPVIIVGDPTFNSSDPVVSRLQNVGSNSFQLRLQEPNYLDNSHVDESVSYLVMEAGNWTLADGTRISAGTHSSNRLTSQGFDTINLTGFDSTPTVLSQVQTFNESDWVTTRTQGQSSSSFQVAMQEEEARNSGSHATETIGWLAIEQGVTEKGDPLLEGGTTSRAHTHTPSTVSFSQSFYSPPSVIAKLGSYYEGDTANLRLGSITSTGFEVRVHEEQSQDIETLHTNESISFLALEGSSGLLW